MLAVTYDQIGNPLNDGTWTYTWENGRQLARMQSVDTDASFVYNENGLRVQKTVNGVVTKYTLHGKNIVHMTQGSNEPHFFYDAQNKPAVVVYNGTPYTYVKNLQGDIVAILDSNGIAVVQYKYDAWGRPITCSGNMKDDLGKLNPFRYRGYVYDEEAGNVYEPTWPKRAKGLVKQGRARFVTENEICLACPPDMKTEDEHMSNVKNIFGDITVADILQRINNIINQTSYITSACEMLTTMGDGDSGVCGSPGNVMGEAKANALAGIVQSREATNQHILRLYEKMYDDLIRLSEAEQAPKENMEMLVE